MPEPLVTVVIPCHNHQKWVNDAIDSVLAQDYPNKEIIVVDNGSADASAESVLFHLENAAGPVRQKDPRWWTGTRRGHDTPITLYSFGRATGPAFARNWGVKNARPKTELFAFLDSDDKYLPGKISRSVARWAESPDHVGVVYTDYETVNEQTGVRIREYKEPFSRERIVRECLVNCDSLVSKLALDTCGLLDEKMRVAEDYDLWLRISERFLLLHVPEALVEIRTGDHSSTSTVPKKVWQECWTYMAAKATARAQKQP